MYFYHCLDVVPENIHTSPMEGIFLMTPTPLEILITGNKLHTFLYGDSSVLHCASLLRTILASLASANECVLVHNMRDFPQARPDSDIKACFLLNKHGDLYFLLHNNRAPAIFFIVFFEIVLGREHSAKVLKKLIGNVYF